MPWVWGKFDRENLWGEWNNEKKIALRGGEPDKKPIADSGGRLFDAGDLRKIAPRTSVRKRRKKLSSFSLRMKNWERNRTVKIQ